MTTMITDTPKTNLERYEKDLDSLLADGEQVLNALQLACLPEQFEAAAKRELGEKAKAYIAKLPDFDSAYQPWYSQAKTLIKQLLPDRLDDFVRHYEKPKSRKDISFENYRIEDGLQGLQITRGYEKAKVVGKEAAIPHMRQQLEILKSVKARFKSSLFDIRQLAMADLFDSELDGASELARNKFYRAAGALAGVVLEKHLHQVCENHSVPVTKKDPGISHLNDQLKAANVIDVPQWRKIQHLGDIRNLCDHAKRAEPTAAQIEELISGVTATTKTLF